MSVPTPTKRDAFGSSLGAFAATLGSAVGLGNIWKFPCLSGSNGGAAFVLTYLLAVVLASSLLIMAFYTDVAGWVLAYVFKSMGAFVSGVTLTPATFQALAGGTWEPVLWQLAVLTVTVGVVAAGVSGGIEKVTKTLMPLLMVLLLACDVRALTLPGASAGVAYLFTPDLSKLSSAVLLSALGLAFFKLSLGMGTMTTYGSYLPDNTRLVPNAVRVALADTLVSLLAGLAIFPAVFALGDTPAGGPGLLFVTIPRVFAQMPGGGLFTALFLMEVPVAWLIRSTRLRRPTAALLTALFMAVLGIPATLSQGPALSHLRVLGRDLFSFFDFLSSNVLLPLGGLAITVVGSWLIPRAVLRDEMSKGHGEPAWYDGGVHVLVRYVTPVLILLIALHSLGLLGGT